MDNHQRYGGGGVKEGRDSGCPRCARTKRQDDNDTLRPEEWRGSLSGSGSRRDV